MNLRSRVISALGTRAENPAWDYIQNIPTDDMFGGFRRQPASFSGLDEMKQGKYIGYRSRVTARWTWAIPDPTTLQWVAKQVGTRGIVEVGAGNGYWAWQLAQLGVDVNAYDIAPVGHKDSWFHEALSEMRKGDDWYDFEVQEFHPVEQGSVEVLERPENAGRVLFLCWPNYDSDFAYSALRTFQGDEFIYVGEFYGCNADWQFGCLIGERWYWDRDDSQRDEPMQEWEQVEEGPMLSWAGIHDRIVKFRRLSEPRPLDEQEDG